jgi:hypothetical protein
MGRNTGLIGWQPSAARRCTYDDHPLSRYRGQTVSCTTIIPSLCPQFQLVGRQANRSPNRFYSHSHNERPFAIGLVYTHLCDSHHGSRAASPNSRERDAQTTHWQWGASHNRSFSWQMGQFVYKPQLGRRAFRSENSCSRSFRTLCTDERSVLLAFRDSHFDSSVESIGISRSRSPISAPSFLLDWDRLLCERFLLRPTVLMRRWDPGSNVRPQDCFQESRRFI